MNVVCCFISNLLIYCCYYTCKCIIKTCNEQDEDNQESTQLMNIKFDKVINTYVKNEDNEEDIFCPITQEKILDGEIVRELQCGHKFSESLNEWIYSNNECPICREKVIDFT